MDPRKLLGGGLLVGAALWLMLAAAFLVSGLVAGQIRDLSALILGLGLLGMLPAALLTTGGLLALAAARREAALQATAELQTEVLRRVQTQGQCHFQDLAREMNVSVAQVQSAIYDLVGLSLFTGYVNWRDQEIIAAEAGQLPEGRCPNCGGEIELAGKGMARCAHCGTETYLPPADQPG